MTNLMERVTEAVWAKPQEKREERQRIREEIAKAITEQVEAMALTGHTMYDHGYVDGMKAALTAAVLEADDE